MELKQGGQVSTSLKTNTVPFYCRLTVPIFTSRYHSSLPSLGNEGHFSQVLAFSSAKLIFYTTLNYLNYGINK